MATLPKEQVTQRDTKATVSVTPGTDSDAGHVQWLSTTTLPYTVVNTTAVAAAYDTPAEILTVMDTYVATLNTEQDLNADFGIGYPSIEQPLVIVGDGTEAMAVAASTTETLDISDFVTGGYQPLVYTIDAASEDEFGTSSMIGSLLQYVAGAGAGADTVIVDVTDADDNTVSITVTVTVS